MIAIRLSHSRKLESEFLLRRKKQARAPEEGKNGSGARDQAVSARP